MEQDTARLTLALASSRCMVLVVALLPCPNRLRKKAR
jgi:hypothetical protein